MNRSIRNPQRERVTKHALASFEPRFEALRQREHALTLEAYQSIYTQEERDLVAACPQNWFRKDNCLDFNRSTGKLNNHFVPHFSKHECEVET